jgi:predicted transcriptional regulator
MNESTSMIPPWNIVAQLRAIAPLRPLTQGDAYTIAERQATKALQLAGVMTPHVSLAWILDQPRTEVQLEPRYKMGRLSGSTTFSKGRYLILVNKNDAHARRRFTLAHEWKHLLDHTASDVLYRQFGHGDPQQRERKIELVADHFAACLLMPRTWVKNAWTSGIQDIPALAGLFMVSEEAIRIRLTYLGLLDEEERPTRTYFRRASNLDLCPIAYQ